QLAQIRGGGQYAAHFIVIKGVRAGLAVLAAQQGGEHDEAGVAVRSADLPVVRAERETAMEEQDRRLLARFAGRGTHPRLEAQRAGRYSTSVTPAGGLAAPA